MLKPEIKKLTGLIFTHPETGEQFGCIRPSEYNQDHPAWRQNWTPIADDGCGNAFLVSTDGSVAFWDHETDEVVQLAADWAAFVRGCAEAKPVELAESKVKSVWVHPSFAKKHGILTP
jgi:SMI1 / KNR4 family (SUKH-1)